MKVGEKIRKKSALTGKKENNGKMRLGTEKGKEKAMTD